MLDSTGIFSKLINILDLFINHHQTLPLFNFARKKGVGAKGATQEIGGGFKTKKPIIANWLAPLFDERCKIIRWLSMWRLGNWRGELPTILKEGLNYISENQEEIHKYAHDDFISVLLKELN